MSVAGTRRLCRVGLAAVLVTALCVLTLLDSPPQLPDPPADPPPTPGGEPPGTRSIVAYSWARRLALDYRPSKECDGNGTYGTTLNTFKLADAKWLETIPGQLFLYSAHLDLRVASYPSLRVIGVKRGPLPTSGLFCTVWYEEEARGRSVSVEALVSTIWLNEWGETVDSYAGVLVGCQLPQDVAIEPSRVYVGPDPCHENASHSLAISQEARNEADDRRRQFTLCIKGLDFDEDISSKLVAFVELHRILGAELFYFYVFNVHENVLRVLRLYERSNVIRWFNLTLPGDLPNEKNARRRLLGEDIWTKRRMELIPYNHCFYENLHRSEFVLPIDIDEAIVPARRRNWHELLLDERIRLGRSFKDFASYAVRNAYFFPELQTKNRTEGSSLDADFLGDLDYLNTVRATSISPEGDSVKSFVSTRRALTVHNHYALTTLNPSTRRAHHFDPEDVLKHHHRACDARHLDCEFLMENVRVDESALRYADELRARMRVVLTDLKAFA
ncbi:uncharacterized protein LOC128891048 [Hylaeus anthracinus]|uniref:uncharacterized protein LOC128891048 n=1 Tax=Hylaeus anthracinus TaxID=313031 RepID=UPI0023B9EA49|nr:uncharacterized protein LOC128891048 [Hylaeus anthracinus]XP_054006186.1 uncharacterized protein LOC128891048 [Hylaeus anthracinus]XP_054006187.1 uncharacterized protein LOC128891048 [Hylaeus anthracinus]